MTDTSLTRKTPDLWGQAIWDFFQNEKQSDLLTETTISEKDIFPIEYLFRSFSQMPKIEQKALELCWGKVLEVGCGASTHGVYLQNEKKLNVTAIDISPLAVKVAQKRGIKNAICADIMQIKGQFDTILLLMNGAGICGRVKHLNALFQHLKKLLTPKGQVLLDSSDIIYMFDKNLDGSYDVPLYFDYYGELDFTIHYKGKQESFPWFYIDFQYLKEIAQQNGFICKKILEGEHYDYLAQLSLK